MYRTDREYDILVSIIRLYLKLSHLEILAINQISFGSYKKIIIVFMKDVTYEIEEINSYSLADYSFIKDGLTVFEDIEPVKFKCVHSYYPYYYKDDLVYNLKINVFFNHIKNNLMVIYDLSDFMQMDYIYDNIKTLENL